MLYYLQEIQRITGFRYNGVDYYYRKNLQGDIIGIINAVGTELISYSYDAWGNILWTEDDSGRNLAELNPYRYRGYYYDTETGLYYLNSRYYDPRTGRFINADAVISLNRGFTGCNIYAYCGNNPVNQVDPIGEAWWHWALGAAIVIACAVAVVATAGGAAAGLMAVAAVGNGMAAATTASTIAAGAFIGSATVYGMSVMAAMSTSNSVQEFSNQGNWGTVASTFGGAVAGGISAYMMTRTPKTTVYRSVSSAEAQDIKTTGRFNLAPGGMECKQFGFSLSETKQFGYTMNQTTVVRAKLPTNMVNQFYTGGVDTNIFRHGTLTVYQEQMQSFNDAVSGTIRIFQ